MHSEHLSVLTSVSPLPLFLHHDGSYPALRTCLHIPSSWKSSLGLSVSLLSPNQPVVGNSWRKPESASSPSQQHPAWDTCRTRLGGHVALSEIL